jgi:hypothetical protein
VCGMDSSGLGSGLAARSCEHGNGPSSGSVRGGDFLD